MSCELSLAFIGNAEKYWDLVPAVVGGVLGALAGGVPAWLIAKRQSEETLSRYSQQRVDNQKSLAFSVMLKIIQIANSIVSLSNHVKSCLALRDNPNYAHLEPYHALIPMAGYTDEGCIRFTSEELAVFISAGASDFVQDVMILASKNSSLLESFKEYCKLRKEMIEKGPDPEFFDGEIAISNITVEQAHALRRYTIPLNNIALQLEKGLDEDVILLRDVARRFGLITKEYFKVDNFGSIVFPTDEELAAKRQPRLYKSKIAE